MDGSALRPATEGKSGQDGLIVGRMKTPHSIHYLHAEHPGVLPRLVQGLSGVLICVNLTHSVSVSSGFHPCPGCCSIFIKCQNVAVFTMLAGH